MSDNIVFDWRNLYLNAHLKDFKERYPNAWKDGHYSGPKYPNVTKANGLTMMICNFLNWSGHRATRINTTGRRIGTGITVTESGARFKDEKWIKGSTRKGTSDVSSTINGRSVMLEVKVGDDKPSPDQLKEQAKERRAGGIYEFIYHPVGFFELYYSLVKNTKNTL